MKKLLFYILFLPFISYGQLDLGVNLGNVQNLALSYKSQVDSSKNYLRISVGYEASSQYTDMHSPFICFEYLRSFKKSDLYAGVNFGWITFDNTTMDQYDANGKGIEYGVHVGYAYDLSKDFYLSAQGNFNYILATIDALPNSNSGYQKLTNYTACTIGIHYKFHFN